MRIWWLALVAVAVSACASAGQVIDKTERMGVPGKSATREWKALLKVEDERLWDVVFGVRALVAPGEGKDGRFALVLAAPVTAGVFVMPWVEQCATQVSDLNSITGGMAVDGQEVKSTLGFVESPAGLQRLISIEAKAPAAQVYGFGSHVAMPKSMPPEKKDIEQVPVATVDLELEYRVTSRRVKLDEKAVKEATWPAAWPAGADGALKDQVFRETGVDAETRLVRVLDDAALDAFAKKFAEARGIKDPKAVGPVELARALAEEVTKRLSYTGTGLIECQSGGGDGDLPALDGAFEGIDVRDALTVIRSGKGNTAERAVAVAAVYRRLGLPCRVIVGFEAKPDDDREVGKKYAQQKSGRGGGGGRVRSGRDPEPRCWVEFAVVNGEGELGWVPVDMGKGGNSMRFGTVTGSEDVVVVATNFWPTPIRVVGALRSIPGYKSLTVVFSIKQRSRVFLDDAGRVRRDVSTSRGSGHASEAERNARRMFELGAGMWGYWMEPFDCPTVYQQLRVDVSRVPVTKRGPQEP